MMAVASNGATDNCTTLDDALTSGFNGTVSVTTNCAKEAGSPQALAATCASTNPRTFSTPHISTFWMQLPVNKPCVAKANTRRAPESFNNCTRERSVVPESSMSSTRITSAPCTHAHAFVVSLRAAVPARHQQPHLDISQQRRLARVALDCIPIHTTRVASLHQSCKPDLAQTERCTALR